MIVRASDGAGRKTVQETIARAFATAIGRRAVGVNATSVGVTT